MPKHPLSKKDFDFIYSKVPRLTVEVCVVSDKGLCLTLRTIEPCAGLWHLPGGTVHFGEPLMEAVKRIAKNEIGLSVEDAEMIGYIEYPDHFQNGDGYPVGIAFKVTDFSGKLKTNEEASGVAWFRELPPNTHPHQPEFIKEKNLI